MNRFFRLNRKCWLLLCLWQLLSSNAALAQGKFGNAFECTAEWDKATLKLGNKSLPAWRSREAWPTEMKVGSHLVRLKESVIEVVDYDSLKRNWIETSRSNTEFRWIGTNHKVLFLLETPLRDFKYQESPFDVTLHEWTSHTHSSLRVLQRVLANGTPLDDIVIEVNPSQSSRGFRLVDVLSTSDATYFLTNGYEETSGTFEKQLTYRVTKFTDKIVWTSEFKSNGSIELPNTAILGTANPAIDEIHKVRMAECATNIVVNAGPTEDILALDAHTGEVKWQTPRLWEYQRGFYGPSVWSYYISRFGLKPQFHGESNPKSTESKVSNSSAESESQQGWTAIGPLVLRCIDRTGDKVEAHSDGPHDNKALWRIFFITAQAHPNTAKSNYLAAAQISELDETGQVISMISLPRLPDATHFHSLAEEIVGRCEGDTLVRILPTIDRSNSDSFTKIFFAPRATSPVRKVDLQQGYFFPLQTETPWGRLSTEEGGFLVNLKEGPRTRNTIHFPIVLNSRPDQATKELLFELPISGKLYLPTDGIDYWNQVPLTRSQYLYMLRRIQSDETSISITLENEKHLGTAIDFKTPGELISAVGS